MDGRLLLAGALLAAGVGFWAFEYRPRRQYLARIQANWEREASHLTPVKAIRYLVNLETGAFGEKYKRGPTGVLCLSDECIVFSDHFRDKDICVPFQSIRWVGVREIEYFSLIQHLLRGARERKHKVRKRVLIVDCEFSDASGPDRWPVYAWSFPQLAEFGATLARLCGLEKSTEGGDFGPTYAIRLIRRSGDRWQESDQGVLFLAPDRLLFNWDDPILCSSIQRAETISTGFLARHLRYSDSIRIDYTGPDGHLQTVGFQVFDSGGWAEQLRSRCYASHKERPMWDKPKDEPTRDKPGRSDPPSG